MINRSETVDIPFGSELFKFAFVARTFLFPIPLLLSSPPTLPYTPPFPSCDLITQFKYGGISRPFFLSFFPQRIHPAGFPLLPVHIYHVTEKKVNMYSEPTLIYSMTNVCLMVQNQM